MFDETIGKALAGSRLSEVVLERGQRAYSAAPFHPDAPDCRGQVKPDHAGPEQAQQTTEEDEQDKTEVQGQGEVSQKPIGHDSFPQS